MPRTKPTQEQIDAEIKALEGCLTYAPARSAFGDDNHRNIRVQIEALKGELDGSSAEFDELPDSEQEAANEAFDWLDGWITHSEAAPSKGWDYCKPKAS